MNKLLKISAAVALAMGAASPSFADVILPSTGSSTLTLSIWDQTNNTTLFVGLNQTFAGVTSGALEAEGGASIANAIFASDQAEVAAYLSTASTNTTWWIAGADGAGLGAFGGRGLVTTGDIVSPPSFTNQFVTQAVGAAESTYARMNNNAAAGGCATDRACAGDSGANFITYGSGASGNAWGLGWGLNAGNLPAGLGNGAAVGTAQAMWLFSTAESAAAAGSGQALVKNLYNNSGGTGSWLLSSDGVLSYTLAASQVPVPAALWLMLSGLGGLGLVGRRRGSKVAPVTA